MEGFGCCLDGVGATVSCLCALHCALIAPLAAALPLLGLGLLADEGAEMALMAGSAALGALGLGLGFRRHGSGRALALMAVGIGLLALGRLVEERDMAAFGTLAVVAGGLSVAGAHLLNRRLCRACTPCDAGGSIGAGVPMSLGSHADNGADSQGG